MEGKKFRQTIFDPLSWRAPFSLCNKQVLAVFCQENIKVNVSECTSPFPKLGLVFCQRAKEACRFLRAPFWCARRRNIAASSQTWSEIHLDSGEFACVALIYFKRTQLDFVILSVKFVNCCFSLKWCSVEMIQHPNPVQLFEIKHDRLLKLWHIDALKYKFKKTLEMNPHIVELLLQSVDTESPDALLLISLYE